MLTAKYFRVFPWWAQLLWFFLLTFSIASVISVIVLYLLPKFSPYVATQLSLVNEQSPYGLIKTATIVQGFLNLGVFLIPALLFAYLAHPEPAKYAGLKAPVKKVHLLLAIFIMIGAMPLLSMIENLVSMINFGAKIKAEQAASESTMNAFMNMPTFSSFIMVFIVMAVVPAFGEELFFRGIFMRLARKKSPGMALPIIFTSAIFSYSHTNIYGYLSIFLAGVLLAVIYNLTSSIWCGILAHMFFNGTQIILSYVGKSNAGVRAFMESNSVPVYLIIGGAIVFGVSFYMLWKTKTPLPQNWTDDFTPEELSQKAD